jgi:flagellar biosynthesis protein FlhB
VSDVEKDQKTEQASDKRQDELRTQGKVAQSHDLISAATLVGVCGALAVSFGNLSHALEGLVMRALRLDQYHAYQVTLAAAVGVLTHTLPALFAAFVFALGSGMAQTKGLFAIELALPNLERLDPMSRLKQLVPGPEMLKETAKSLAKILALGVVIKKVITAAFPRLLVLGAEDPRVAASEVADVATDVVLWGSATFLVVAAVDYFVALRKFQKDAMMSRQELKEEFKQEEADPQLKRKMRTRARELMAQRKAGGVEKATVLVTNPTHIAIALRYAPEENPVPIVVGKAIEESALMMRAQARKRSIPIVENRPLARALHKTTKVGRPIPADLYRAVAEVIAHVLRLRGGRTS